MISIRRSRRRIRIEDPWRANNLTSKKKPLYSTNGRCLLRVRPASTWSTFFYPEGGKGSPQRGGRERSEGEGRGGARGAASFVKGRQRGTWCHDYVGNARTWGSPIAHSFGEGARGRVEGPLDARRHHDGWERQCLFLLRRDSKGRRRSPRARFVPARCPLLRSARRLRATPNFRVTIDHPIAS